MSEMQWTRLNPRWLVKQFAVAALFSGFGLWGLYDALVVYPARGVAYSQYAKYQYLEQVKRKNSGSFGEVSIADPAAEFQKLHKEGTELRDPVDKAKLEWLESLAVIHRLTPAEGEIKDAAAVHAELDKAFTANGAGIPKKLEWFDIPSQWAIFVAGGVIGFGMFGFAAVVSRTKYGWDGATLTIPGGATLTAAQCEDFDRRKWDKFLMFIRVKNDHPTLAGQELKFDLLRYVPLESWVVEMEYTAFPERKAEAEAAAAETAPGAPA